MTACSLAAIVGVLASALGVSSPLRAQEILPGLRVRNWVTPPGEWQTGTLVRFGRDSLVLKRCGECTPEAQPWARVTRVEVSEGYSWSGRNTAIGGLAGGVIAILIDKRKVNRNAARCHDGPCALETLEIPVIGLLGAGAGAILGSFWRVESWREIYGEPARN